MLILTSHMSSDVKNFFMAIVISIVIFLGFNFFYPSAEPPKTQAVKTTSTTTKTSQNVDVEQMSPILARTILDRKEALQLSNRVSFENRVVQGSINLKTGVVDDLQLKNYKETTKKDSPMVSLLHPQDTAKTNILGLTIVDVDATKPDETPWASETTKERQTVVLTKTLPKMTIKRTFTFGDDYTISVSDVVINTSSAPLKLRGIQKIYMAEHDLVDSFTGIADDKLRELTPAQVTKKDMTNYQTTTGWIGAGTKYWFTALIQNQNMQSAILLAKTNYGYEISLSSPVTVVGPGAKMNRTYLSFCGPKKLDVLEHIRDARNVRKFDLAVDFGWFYFITKPLLKGINAVHAAVGNFGWAILILTTLMKIFLWPLAFKSHKSMSAMKALQPKMNKLKEKFSTDKMRLNQEIMALYKKENVKPMGGCLPILLQIPIFFCLYKVLSINIEMRHAPFIWWIKDLAEPDPTSFANLFGILPFDVPQVLMIGLLPILMGLTMFIQQKLTPSVGADPSQEKVMLLMPFFMTYIFASFPSGLVLYWLWSNILSILQQIWMNRRYP